MSDKKLTNYHNPGCSKSRAALAILQDSGKPFNVIEYLVNPPTDKQLVNIIKLLGVPARELLRRSDEEHFNALIDDNGTDDREIIETICNNPILLQRPIIINGEQAVIARPPEKVFDILSSEN